MQGRKRCTISTSIHSFEMVWREFTLNSNPIISSYGLMFVYFVNSRGQLSCEKSQKKRNQPLSHIYRSLAHTRGKYSTNTPVGNGHLVLPARTDVAFTLELYAQMHFRYNPDGSLKITRISNLLEETPPFPAYTDTSVIMCMQQKQLWWADCDPSQSRQFAQLQPFPNLQKSLLWCQEWWRFLSMENP